jgi:hypothetical protein
MQAHKRVMIGVRAAALLAVTLTGGCAAFTPPSAEGGKALESYARWTTPGARPAATMQDMIDLGMVHRPEPCEPLQPTCAIVIGSVIDPSSIAQVMGSGTEQAKRSPPVDPTRSAR